MPTKFYYADNCNRIIKSNGLSFQFEPVERHAGSWRGIFATDKPDEQAALDELCKNPKTAVSSINEEEHLVKKKLPPRNADNWQPLAHQEHSTDQTSDRRVVAVEIKAPNRVLDYDPGRILQGNTVLIENPGPENAAEPSPVVTGEPVKGADEALVLAKVAPGTNQMTAAEPKVKARKG